uniref:Eukaryotic translation elongation factor 1 gamma n=1 Tax=Schistosoma japonicum TaxID=6182 RepID=C1LB52_SCHJA|nr:eukaryotic translation elongation factor 1 gamma [Schistosoma japonicum]
MVSGTLYTPEGYHRSWRAQIAAQFSGATLNIVNFVPGVTDSDKSFLDKFPPATVPVFEANDGTCLFDVNAIAYFLGTDQLRGWKNTHLVTQWVNYADNSILPSVATWVYPCLGITQFNKQNTEKAKTCIASVLKFLNEQLSKITFLVGDRLSQADITVFTALHLLFTHVYEEKDRKPYPHVVRWYTTIANQPEVLKVVGPSSFCIKAAQFDAKKYAELHKKVLRLSNRKKQRKKNPSPKFPPKKKSPKMMTMRTTNVQNQVKILLRTFLLESLIWTPSKGYTAIWISKKRQYRIFGAILTQKLTLSGSVNICIPKSSL